MRTSTVKTFLAAISLSASALVMVTAPATAAPDTSGVHTLATAVTPAAPTVSRVPALVGEKVTLSGDIGTPAVRTVVLQKLGSSWATYATSKTLADGKYSFTASTTAASRQFRVFAKAEGGLEALTSAPATITTVADSGSLSIVRDGGTSTAKVTGTMTPKVPGRLVAFQYKSGSSWKAIGSKIAQDADGKVQTTLDLTGLSQWSTRDYRLVGDAVNGSSTATTPTIKFMPGPTQLGPNVLRVDVDKAVFPTSKSTEYTGVATLSTNGTIALNHVPLENFGVRGTSTAKFDKKAYKLKFLNSTTVFGMPKSKSWSLLANWLDRSNVRDKVGLELGQKLDGIRWTPDSRYVEMFVNDQYRGAYLMTESVKIDGKRVDVDETQGMIMETDGRSVDDSSLGFKSSKGIVFQFKDPDERKTNPDGTPDPKSVTSAKLTAIKNRVNAFESKLYSSSTRDQYPDFIDVDSAIDFYLVKEFTKDRDADFFRSNYFSWDPSLRPNEPLSDGKLHFGPAWDFDRSAGITSEPDAIHRYVASVTGFYVRGTGIDIDHPNYRTHWFAQLFKSQAFQDQVDARWSVVKQEFEEASDDARAAAVELGAGAENDRKRWVGSRQYASRGSYQGEIDYVANWYRDRYVWMNNNL